MSCLTATDKLIAVSNNLQIDIYDHKSHRIVVIPSNAKLEENDHLIDISLSPDSQHLGAITSCSKQLVLLDLLDTSNPRVIGLPRSASKIRFTLDNTCILVADKSGDVLIYNVDTGSGTKILGHLSLLLDILQTNNEKFIITCDRDEKIKVSYYPNTYNIRTFCLGHKEFVNHLELLPSDDNYLLSTSGDGTVRLWKYTDGSLCYTIQTFDNINNEELKNNFANIMDEDGIEVSSLPIVHCSVMKLDEASSLLALTVLSYNKILLYCITKSGVGFSHKVENEIELDSFPSAICFYNKTLLAFDKNKFSLSFYDINYTGGSVLIELTKVEQTFKGTPVNEIQESIQCLDSIKILFKRKFDNVQEYQERKKKRLEKTELKI